MAAGAQAGRDAVGGSGCTGIQDGSILDAILTGYMNDNLSAEDIMKLGYSAEDVLKVIRLIKRNEYKRRQSAPGVKISTCAFGRDWRYPLTSGF